MAELVKPPISIIDIPEIIENIKEEVKSEPVDPLGGDGTEENILIKTEVGEVPAKSFNVQGKYTYKKCIKLFTPPCILHLIVFA